jgi:hypothetical protein
MRAGFLPADRPHPKKPLCPLQFARQTTTYAFESIIALRPQPFLSGRAAIRVWC